MTKKARLEQTNELIDVIAHCGRRFFQHRGFVSSLELSENGRVYFIDYYTRKRIYTHNTRRWKGFTSGGTLRRFVMALRDYVMNGTLLNTAYFICSGDDFLHPWEYGDDLNKVRVAARRLGLCA